MREASWPTRWTGLVLGLVTAGGYLVWLGWDQRYDVDSSGVVTGPYEAWQVAGLVIWVAALAAYAARRRRSDVARVVIPVVMTVCFAADAATDTETYGASLWPLGAALVGGATTCGVAVVTSLAASPAARPRRDGRTS